MVSKTLLILGVVLVSLMLISSEVAARELAEEHELDTTHEKAVKTNGVEDAKYRGYGGYGGGERGGYDDGRGGYGGRGGGGYCRRCCRHGNCYCCSDAEIAELEAKAKPHN